MVQGTATDAAVDNLEADYDVIPEGEGHFRCEEMMPTETTVGVGLAQLAGPAERPAEMQADHHFDLRAAGSAAAVGVRGDLVPLNYLTGRSSASDRFH